MPVLTTCAYAPVARQQNNNEVAFISDLIILQRCDLFKKMKTRRLFFISKADETAALSCFFNSFHTKRSLPKIISVKIFYYSGVQFRRQFPDRVRAEIDLQRRVPGRNSRCRGQIKKQLRAERKPKKIVWLLHILLTLIISVSR